MTSALVTAIYSIIILIFVSILGRFILISVGQTWVKTFAHTATLIFLPLITFVITKVISGNIALSLGMVGALSIIRFRNPVRSPFELTVYFAAITMGISASVSLKWLLFLSFSLALAFVSLLSINFFYKNVLKKEFFMTSFSEGNSLSTLSIKTNESVEHLESHQNLVSMSKVDEGYNYVLAASNIKELNIILTDVQKEYNLIDFRLTK